MVAIGHSFFQGLEQHGSDAAAKNSPLAERIEGAAVPIQGVKVALFCQVPLNLRHTHYRTSYQHHIALVESKVLARLVDRDQGRGTRRLNCEARTAKIELERNTRAQKIL